MVVLRPVEPPRELMAMPSPDAKKGRERPSVTKSPRVRWDLYRAERRPLQESPLRSRCKSAADGYCLFCANHTPKAMAETQAVCAAADAHAVAILRREFHPAQRSSLRRGAREVFPLAAGLWGRAHFERGRMGRGQGCVRWQDRAQRATYRIGQAPTAFIPQWKNFLNLCIGVREIYTSLLFCHTRERD